MELVILDRVEYIKASAIAKQFNYTSDYIGQLCRGKKVDARLVGRTWFVNPKSLTEHKKSKYSKQVSASESDMALNREEEKKQQITPVEAVLKSKTSKYLSNSGISESKKLKVHYEKDEENLIPHITKKVILPPKTIRIEQAEAKKILVDGSKAPYSFKTDPIPEVALSGKLTVESIPEPDTLEEVLDSPELVENVSDINKNIAISPKREEIKMDIDEKSDTSTVAPIQSPHKKEVKKVASVVRNIPRAPKHFTTITPRSKSSLSLNSSVEPKNPIKFTPTSLEKLQPVKISNAVLLSPLIATILALVVVTALFSASSNVEVSSSSYNSKVVLQMANLLEVLQSE